MATEINRRLVKTILLPIFFAAQWLVLATSALGQTNTNCANSIALTNTIPLSVNTSSATSVNNPTDSCGVNLSHAVWFTVTPTNNQRVVISTAGSTFPTGLAIYTGTCGLFTNVQCSEPPNFNGNGTANVDFSSVSNITYHILAGGVSGSSGTLVITTTLTNPPPNDTCAGAIDLTTIKTDTEDITHATELGDATDSCGVNLSHAVWFTVTPTNNQRVVISTAGSTFPTGLAIYTGTCGLFTNVQCSEPPNFNGNGTANVDFSSVSNITYHILAGGVSGSSGTLVITTTLTNPPPNDTCAGAIDLTTIKTDTEDITHATELGDATDSCGVNLSHAVWFTVTPTNNQRVVISTAGSTFPTGLAIYTGTCGLFTNVQCSEPPNFNGNGTANVDFSSVSNITYHILAGGVSGSSGTLVITTTLTNPPPNDTCAGAIDLTTIKTDTEDITHATELGDATDSCGVNLSHAVWFTVTPTNNQRVVISTAGSTFPTGLAIYTGTCGLFTNVQCSEPPNFNGNGTANVDFSSVSNITYHILAGGVSGSSGTLVITTTLTNPPPNDTCAGAIDLTTIKTDTEDITHATELGDATDSCGVNLSHAVWFTVTPTNNQRVVISTAGSTFPTGLAIYTGTCGLFTNVQCSEPPNFNGNGTANVDFSSVSNITYHILAGGVSGSSGTLVITTTLTNPPPNDTCAGAIDLTTIKTDTEDITHATELGDATDSCGVNLSHAVWFTVTPTNNQRVVISTAGSTFPTGLAIYTGTCGLFTNVQCSEPPNFNGNGTANVDFSSVSNITYHILAGGVSGSSGTLVITTTLTNPPPNDTCAGAIDLTTIKTDTEDITHATELGDATDSCGVNLSHAVWFTVTPTNNQRVVISTAGSTFPTGLAIYTGTCGLFTNVQCSEPPNFNGNGTANVDFSSVSNITYHILAGGVSGSSGTLVITTTLTNPPPNDTCAGAIDLTTIKTDTEDITHATELGDATDSCGVNLSHAVWFTVTPTNNQRVVISTAGSTFPTGLAIYTGTCGLFTNVQCSEPPNFNGNGTANVDFSSVSNITYHILAGGVSGSSGTLVITTTLTNPPPNDTCAGAFQLINGLTNIEDTTHATEIGDPALDCQGSVGHGVWFTLEVFSNQPVTISTCGSSYATSLLVYSNGCGSLGNPLICARGTTPFNCSGNAGVQFTASVNSTYYILALGQGTQAGNLQIVANVPPPANDICSNAISMMPGITYSNDTTYATSINDPVPSCQPNFGRGIWYQYTPTANGPVGVTTCGSAFPTGLAVYTGGCGSFKEVACSQSSGAYCGSGNADVNFMGTAGTAYYILAGGVNGQAGKLQILLPVVDLVPTSLTATNPAGGLPTAGRGFTASWTIANQGSNSISGSWTDTLILSNATTNVVLKNLTGNHNAVAGGTYSEGINNQLLPQIPPGNYSLIVQADTTQSVVETNEANNSFSNSVTVTNIAPQINLLISTNLDGDKVCVPQLLSLSAQVTVGSYNIAQVEYYLGGNKIATASNGPNYATNTFIFYGANSFTAQAADSFGFRTTSQPPVLIRLFPPDTNVLIGELDTNHDCVFCMGTFVGSNYVIETVTNIAPPANWQPFLTNLATGTVIYFTNAPTNPARYFRVLRTP